MNRILKRHILLKISNSLLIIKISIKNVRSPCLLALHFLDCYFLCRAKTIFLIFVLYDDSRVKYAWKAKRQNGDDVFFFCVCVDPCMYMNKTAKLVLFSCRACDFVVCIILFLRYDIVLWMMFAFPNIAFVNFCFSKVQNSFL